MSSISTSDRADASTSSAAQQATEGSPAGTPNQASAGTETSGATDQATDPGEQGGDASVTQSVPEFPKFVYIPRRGSNPPTGQLFDSDGDLFHEGINHRPRAMDMIAGMVLHGLATESEAVRLRGQVEDSGLPRYPTIQLEFIQHGYAQSAALKLGSRMISLKSKTHGRRLIQEIARQEEHHGAYLTLQSVRAATEAVEASALVEMTEEEAADKAPAQFKSGRGDLDHGLRSGILYAAGTRPIAEVFSTQAAHKQLCIAIDGGLILEKDRKRIEGEINAQGAAGLPEHSDVDVYLDRVAATGTIFILRAKEIPVSSGLRDLLGRLGIDMGGGTVDTERFTGEGGSLSSVLDAIRRRFSRR
jgi:hypothetical protein